MLALAVADGGPLNLGQIVWEEVRDDTIAILERTTLAELARRASRRS